MMPSEAYVTCATSDDLVKGALVLSYTIKRFDPHRPTVVIVGPLISLKLLKELGTLFTYVIRVNLQMTKHSQLKSLLYANPSLQKLLTKYFCWTLTSFSKCVFMNSSMMVLNYIGDAFSRPTFSSAPEISWPDLFNSGFFVYEPSVNIFNSIIDFIGKNSSPMVDDNMIMNEFFADWHHLNITHRLPYVYNVQIDSNPTNFSALIRYERNIKAVQFGSNQHPWNYLEKNVDHDETLNKYINMWCSAYINEVQPFVSHVLNQEAFENKTKQDDQCAVSFEDQLNISKMNWEQGNIDFMGAHSFDHIQKRLDEMRLSNKKT
ncbi:hypothetical protein HELRODRAFT_77815 [Helobdella robusta]|uniref:Uncharacterized protein n=1 Tax=Helobdella robusta TaxID=6412 RepID=T1G345_HELRO|nr:hypothetical protein HELRODRAFT_77815 [Helobdella robusta]ESO05171.1 hypothetical protein HELRODRAFT_77815 [Helobdella robusta]